MLAQRLGVHVKILTGDTISYSTQVIRVHFILLKWSQMWKEVFPAVFVTNLNIVALICGVYSAKVMAELCLVDFRV